MYGHKHPLTYKSTQGEKMVGNFTLKQITWILIGGYLSFKLAQHLPQLPFESVVFRNFHYFIPMAVCAIFGFTREAKTGLHLYSYCYYWLMFHRRPRKLTYKRGDGN